jgi:predicted permease
VPDWAAEVRARLRSLRLSATRESEIVEELSQHLEDRWRDLIAGGAAPDEATRLSLADFREGNVLAKHLASLRQAHIPAPIAPGTPAGNRIDELLQDLRYSLRTLLKRPSFTATAVLSLAIGIGASASIFSLVDQVLLRLLPVKDPQRLVLVDWRGPQFAAGMGSGNLLSYPLCRDLQEQTQFFDGVFCRHPTSVTVVVDNQAQPVAAELVSGTYFNVLGVRPALGRLLDPSDDLRPRAEPVVVLSHDYWRTAFGASPDAVGRTLIVNSRTLTIVGVAEPKFRGVDLGEVPALWIPTTMTPEVNPGWDRLLDRRARWLHVFGRLAPGVSADAARAGLQPWFKQMLRSDMAIPGFPKVDESQRAKFLASTLDVMPASQGRSKLRGTLGGPLWMLLAGTVLLHLLASANVASLMLARGASRVREMQTRIALGASRRRLTRLVAVDSLLLALGGGAVGLLLAPLISLALLSFLPQEVAAVDLAARVDARVFLFALVAGAASAGLCGVALASQVGRAPLTSLNERAGNTSGLRLRKALVVAQVALALNLLVGAGLLVQTLARLYAKGPGFATSHLLTFGINLSARRYPAEQSERLARQLFDAMGALPNVESAAISGLRLVDGGSWNQQLTVEADQRITTDRVVHLNPVSPGFFSTLGVRVVAGRGFDERDERRPGQVGGQPAVVVVNESFARRYFGGRSPLGRRLGLGVGPDTRTDLEIVGVVRDFSYRNLREETEQVFLAFFPGAAGAGAWYYIKVRGRPESAIASVRETTSRIDPTLPILGIRSFDAHVDRALATERMLATLSTAFGVTAMLLAVVGLYGVMSFVVASRTLEIGIRMALGATRASVLRQVVGNAAAMVGVGMAIAVPCLWGVSRLVRAQLFDVDAIHPPTIAAASALLAVAALGGALFPAWRAASVQPTAAMRAD